MDACANTPTQSSHWKTPGTMQVDCYRTRNLGPSCLLLIQWLLVLPLLPAVTWAAPFAYITNESNHTVSVIDTETNALLATVNVALGPEGVAVNPTGTRVYVANLGPDTVSVIDTTTNVEVANVPVAVFPFGVVVNSAGTRVYVKDLFDDTVSIIDTATNTEMGVMKLND